MQKAAFLFTVFLMTHISPADAAPSAKGAVRVDLELVLAVDVSGSIDETESRLQRKGYVEAFTSPEVLSAIRSGFHKRVAVTYFEWAGYEHNLTIVDWTLVSGPDSARKFANALAAKPLGVGPYTSISGAIEYAMPLFEKNKFAGTRQVIDISGDGPNNSGRLVTTARTEALQAGLTINGLPIINTRPSRYGNPPMPNLDLYYKKCVIGGPRAFIVVAEDFRSFAKAIRKKLVLEIAGRAPSTSRSIARKSRRMAGAHLVSRTAPPCNIGESRRQFWSSDY
ncbi:MAG: DUF1194 domain-containing protein [Nitrospinaceae bacterium]|nr:DUF1194 domain-containing protein [Nitrospinaceae bacterium]